MAPNAPTVRCRPITDADLPAIIDLLSAGFPRRERRYWIDGFERLSRREVPEGCPRYGYLMEADGRTVGTILLIGSWRISGEAQFKIANVASWYVTPDFRSYAPLLVSVALRSKDLTYLNISAARHTWPIVESQGYLQYCAGLFFALAPLVRPVPDTSVIEVTAGADGPELKALAEYDMLREHASYGCISLVCRSSEGLHPFIFRPFRIRSGRVWTPAALAIHCRDQQELVRFAGNLGRFLVRRAMPIMIMDANGPIDGLPGFYSTRRGRKYFRGPYRPRLCDLAETEFAIFGL